MFELAMQAVDPSVSLPYWDYSIDTAAGIKLNESFIFTPDTFGSLNSPVNPAWYVHPSLTYSLTHSLNHFQGFYV
jgi:hypothetical protein